MAAESAKDRSLDTAGMGLDADEVIACRTDLRRHA
jgi:hypothetical protein